MKIRNLFLTLAILTTSISTLAQEELETVIFEGNQCVADVSRINCKDLSTNRASKRAPVECGFKYLVKSETELQTREFSRRAHYIKLQDLTLPKSQQPFMIEAILQVRHDNAAYEAAVTSLFESLESQIKALENFKCQQ